MPKVRDGDKTAVVRHTSLRLTCIIGRRHSTCLCAHAPTSCCTPLASSRPTENSSEMVPPAAAASAARSALLKALHLPLLPMPLWGSAPCYRCGFCSGPPLALSSPPSGGDQQQDYERRRDDTGRERMPSDRAPGSADDAVKNDRPPTTTMDVDRTRLKPEMPDHPVRPPAGPEMPQPPLRGTDERSMMDTPEAPPPQGPHEVPFWGS